MEGMSVSEARITPLSSGLQEGWAAGSAVLAGRVGHFCAQLRPPRLLAVNCLFSRGVK